MDLLQYAFFQNALIGSLLTAIACGIVGTYIVSRRLVFISGGITHASFGGLGLGFYLGTNPILMAMLFSILSAWRGVGEQDAKRKGGFRHSGRMVAGYGFGRDLYLPYAGVCPESVRLFVR